MPDKDQFGIYSKDELSLIKNTFSGDDTLLYTIRKVLLQFPMTEAEKGLIQTTITPEVHKVIKKRLLAEIGPESPLSQLVPGILPTLTNDLKTKDVVDMALQFEAKVIETNYLAQQLSRLQDLGAEEPIKLADLALFDNKDHTQRYVDITAYLFLLGYIDPMLGFIKSIAGEKNETPEEQAQRLKRDSSK